MRKVGVVTTARSDYSIYLPVLGRLRAAPDLQLNLIVSGTHLSPEFGNTQEIIAADGFEISERVEMLLSSDTPEGIAKSMGLGGIGFAQVYARNRPDLLVVLGDRYEMHSAALAALPFNIPVAHIHGGELTQGAIDDALRHSLTKLSHLHFAACPEYAQRIIQMGEEPWRVIVSGAPALDNLRSLELLTAEQLEELTGLRLETPPLVATFHPVTLETDRVESQIGQLLAALNAFSRPIIFSAPNADTNGRIIRRRLEAFVREHPSARVVENLGARGYFSLLSRAAVMVGNSSSGIIEAPSLKLPVVNIGTRQEGRTRAANIIDVEPEADAIIAAIHRALQPAFRESLAGLVNPHGEGKAAETIVQTLSDIPLDDTLLRKRFYDLPAPSDAGAAGMLAANQVNACR